MWEVFHYLAVVLVDPNHGVGGEPPPAGRIIALAHGTVAALAGSRECCCERRSLESCGAGLKNLLFARMMC